MFKWWSFLRYEVSRPRHRNERVTIEQLGGNCTVAKECEGP